VAVCCEHGTELSGSIKGGEILEQLSNYWRLKKDSAPLFFSLSRDMVLAHIFLCCPTTVENKSASGEALTRIGLYVSSFSCKIR